MSIIHIQFLSSKELERNLEYTIFTETAAVSVKIAFTR
jgi:hypothetical protein